MTTIDTSEIKTILSVAADERARLQKEILALDPTKPEEMNIAGELARQRMALFDRGVLTALLFPWCGTVCERFKGVEFLGDQNATHTAPRGHSFIRKDLPIKAAAYVEENYDPGTRFSCEYMNLDHTVP